MRLKTPAASTVVLGLLCAMYLITYVDRVNIATAADSINVAATGRYHCELVRGGDGHWRFRVRTCVETGGPLPDGALRQPSAH